MGSDLTLFIEFYGLPGCGKSTISHKLAGRLRSLGKTVSEPTYDIDHGCGRIARKIRKTGNMIKYAVINPGNNKALNNLISVNGYTGARLISMKANIANKLLSYSHSKTSFVIFDEGLTQSAISLVNEGSDCISNEECLYALKGTGRVFKVYVRVPYDIVLDRMSKRDEHNSRIEAIDDPVMREREIRRLETACEMIEPDLVLDNRSVDEAVDEVIRHII